MPSLNAENLVQHMYIYLCNYLVRRKLKHSIIGNPRNKQHFAKLGVVEQLSLILNDQELTDNVLLAECITTLGSFAHGMQIAVLKIRVENWSITYVHIQGRNIITE